MCYRLMEQVGMAQRLKFFRRKWKVRMEVVYVYACLPYILEQLIYSPHFTTFYPERTYFISPLPTWDRNWRGLPHLLLLVARSLFKQDRGHINLNFYFKVIDTTLPIFVQSQWFKWEIPDPIYDFGLYLAFVYRYLGSVSVGIWDT